MSNIYKYVGTRRFNGLPQDDIDADAFARLSAARRHIVLHSGDWSGDNVIEGGALNPGFETMKRDDLDKAAPDYGIDPKEFDRVDELRSALIAAYENKEAR